MRREAGMETFDVTLLLPSLVMMLLPLIPVIYLLKRIGMSLAWALLLLFPFFGLVVLLWIIAFGRWKRFGID
jgi:hypothetical protein